MQINLVQMSRGMGVPLYSYVEDRKHLIHWVAKPADDGIRAYRTGKNQISLDGKSTKTMDSD